MRQDEIHPFWAASPEGRCPVEYRGYFVRTYIRLYVHPSVCTSVRPYVHTPGEGLQARGPRPGSQGQGLQAGPPGQGSQVRAPRPAPPGQKGSGQSSSIKYALHVIVSSERNERNDKRHRRKIMIMKLAPSPLFLRGCSQCA